LLLEVPSHAVVDILDRNPAATRTVAARSSLRALERMTFLRIVIPLSLFVRA
jgi:hypothetical protein